MSKKLIFVVSFVLVLGLVGSVSADLVAHWKFNEGSGNVAHDTSGNGNDGTFVGDPQWAAGKIDGALEFNGSSDYIEVPFSESLRVINQGDFSIAAWFRLNEIPSEYKVVFQQGDDTSGGPGRTWLFVHQSNEIRSSLGGTATGSGVGIEGGTWYHSVVVVTEGGTTDSVQLYVNGEPAGAPRQDSMEDSEGVFYIGCHKALGNIWDGLLDDIRIYNHALSEAKIRKLAVGPQASKPNPANGSAYEDTWANLSWTPGSDAVSHDVYLGDNFDDVNAGAESTFRGNQALMTLIVGFPGFPYPDGLVPGTTYYWRIDEVNDLDPNSPWKGNVWSFMIPPKTAYDPIPTDGIKFIDPNVELGWTAGFGAKLHTVYFGDNFDDVNNAVVGLPQSETTYTPGTLELEKVYYWRVDEFDGTATLKGDVWSFKTQPDIPITDPNLVGWWTLDEGAGTNALDWSGHGNHGVLFGPQWAIPGLLGNAALSFDGTDYVAIQNLSYNSTDNTEVTVCAWIRTSSAANQYIASFDRDNYWRLEINGSGAGDGQVGWDVMTSSGQLDYGSVTRVDDGLWHHVCGVFDNGQSTIYIDGSAEPSAAGGPTFGSGNMRYGFIGANSEATSFNGSRGGGSAIFGEIDELRIYHKALTQEEILVAMRGDLLLAWNPKPSQGSILYIRDATPLSWSPGDNASGHDVYFGTDKDAVVDADASDTTGIYRGRQGVTIYTPPEVEWGGGPYYWRVDEYNTDATISKGNVWSFTVTDFIGIEDFEDCNDYEPDRIYETWIDGWGTTTNGSTVGYPDPNFDQGEHFVETNIVHGGGQSMPFFYDNNFKYSEATMTPTQRDWTEEGVGVLSLWFYGDTSNAAERMYVNLNGIATVYHDNPDAALIDTWTEWTIDLQEFAAKGVNLANVNTIAIGFGDKNNLQAGGSGVVYFDDIRLYRPAPPEPEPAP